MYEPAKITGTSNIVNSVTLNFLCLTYFAEVWNMFVSCLGMPEALH